MIKLLCGTGNPGKIDYFKYILQNYQYELVYPAFAPSIQETGHNSEENARIKALAYHKTFGMASLAMDSTLVFPDLPLDDPRQPGTYVRRVHGQNLDDEEMIQYYSAIAASCGGQIRACWLGGYAVCNEKGELYSYSDDVERATFLGIILTSIPHNKRVKGLPLDSTTLDMTTGKYLYDLTEEERTAHNPQVRALQAECDAKISTFIAQALQLPRK